MIFASSLSFTHVEKLQEESRICPHSPSRQ